MSNPEDLKPFSFTIKLICEGELENNKYFNQQIEEIIKELKKNLRQLDHVTEIIFE